MLRLRNISKKYSKNFVLNDINLDFKENELVFILGKSGSGKSTLLNIIGGNLKSDSGIIYYNGNEISKFNDRKMCNYRGNIIGFIFQDYNLFNDLNVYQNVIIGSENSKIKKVDDVLKKLEIFDKKYSKVKDLSGGEKQRVAIARVILKKSKVILADEPTGALDSSNGIKIMDILKELSHEKLVIVVSHDLELARKYADRIINIVDGKIDSDFIKEFNDIFFNISKFKYNFIKRIKYAFKDLLTNMRRNIITCLSLSIGIMTLILVLSFFKNFNKELNNLEEDIISSYPVIVRNGIFNENVNINNNSYDKVFLQKDKYKEFEIDNGLINYINSIDNINVNYKYDILINMITDKYKYIDNNFFDIIPNNDYINNNYELISGRLPDNNKEIILKISNDNTIDNILGSYFDINDNIDYDDLIGRKIKVISNDDFFVYYDGIYYKGNDYDSMYNKSNYELEIVGIIRGYDGDFTSGILFSDLLYKDIININMNSNIVNNQLMNDNVIVNFDMGKDKLLSYLGYNTIPDEIYLFFDSISMKDTIINDIKDYNSDVYFIDVMKDSIDTVKNFMLIISVILIIFSSISIFISIIMISLLTSIRVIEKKKDVGILRNLGLNKKNIISIFNLENIFLCIISTLIAVLSLLLLKNPINNVINKYLQIDNIFVINSNIILTVFIIISILILLISYIPSRNASRMEIVDCIYNK